jgi:hypothetical protein
LLRFRAKAVTDSKHKPASVRVTATDNRVAANAEAKVAVGAWLSAEASAPSRKASASLETARKIVVRAGSKAEANAKSNNVSAAAENADRAMVGGGYTAKTDRVAAAQEDLPQRVMLHVVAVISATQNSARGNVKDSCCSPSGNLYVTAKPGG